MVEEFVSTPQAFPTPRVGARGAAAANGTTAMGVGTAAGVGAIRSLETDNQLLDTLNWGNTIGNTALGAEALLIPAASGALYYTAGKLPYVGGRIRDGIGYTFNAPLAAIQRTTIGDLMAGNGALGRHYHDAGRAYSAQWGTLKGTASGHAIMAAADRAQHAVSIATPAAVASSGAFNTDTLVNRLYASRASSGLNNLSGTIDSYMQGLQHGGGGFIAGTGRKLMYNLGLRAAPEISSLPSEVQAVHTALGELKTAISGPAHLVDMAHANACVARVHDAAKVASDAGHGGYVKSLIGGMAPATTEMGRILQGIGGHMNAARTSTGTLAAIGAAVKGMPIMDVAVKGGFMVGTGYYSLRTITHATEAISYLKEMNKDLTGQSISTWQILTGSGLSPMMREARANLFARFGPEAVADAAGAVLNVMFMNRNLGASAMPLMMGATAIQMSAASLAPKQHLLDSYIAIKDMQAQGMRVPVEAYAALVDAASGEARKIGGERSRLVQGIAMEYEMAQMKPTQILQEIEGKTAFHTRAQHVAEAIAAEDKLHAKKLAHSKSLDALPAAAHHDPIKVRQAATGIPTTLAATQIQHEGKLHQAQKQVGA